MPINSQMKYFSGHRVLTDDLRFENTALTQQDNARISDIWTDGVIQDPNGLSNMTVAVDGTTTTLFNVGHGTAYAHGYRIDIDTSLGYDANNASFTTNGICTPRSSGNQAIPLTDYSSGVANHVWAEYLTTIGTGRTAVSFSDGTVHYPQEQDGYRIVVSLTNDAGNNDGITNAVYLATIYGQGAGQPLSSNPVTGLTDSGKVYLSNRPSVSYTLANGSVRGSSANSGGSQREILQGTVSTPDLRDSAVSTIKVADAAVTAAKINQSESFSIGSTSGGLHVGGSSDAGDNNLVVDGTIQSEGNSYLGATSGGLHVGGTSDPGDNNLLADGTITSAGNMYAGTTSGGLHVGGASDPGDNNLLVDGTLETTGASTFTGLVKTVGGVHVGGTSDPGTDNMLVDGTLEVTGASTLTGLVKTVGGVHVGGTSDPGADNLTVDGTASLNGLTVTGGGSLTAPNNLGVVGNETIGGNLGVNGTIHEGGSNRVFSGSSMFESSEQTIAALMEVAHGLGGTPRMVRGIARCKVAEYGYSIGDEVDVASSDIDSGTGLYYMISSVYCNSTYIGMTKGEQLLIYQKGGTDQRVISDPNWKIVLRAWY